MQWFSIFFYSQGTTLPLFRNGAAPPMRTTIMLPQPGAAASPGKTASCVCCSVKPGRPDAHMNSSGPLGFSNIDLNIYIYI